MRKSTSMTLDLDVLNEARALGLNISKAAEQGIRAAIKEEAARRWKKENAQAIQDYNDYVEANGIPLAEHRQF